MRQEYSLGDANNPNTTDGLHPNTFQAHLWWTPNVAFLLNNTSNPFFLNEGSSAIPTTTVYNKVVPPGASLRLPVNVNEFGGFLPTNPPLVDSTQVVTVIFDQLPIGVI